MSQSPFNFGSPGGSGGDDPFTPDQSQGAPDPFAAPPRQPQAPQAPQQPGPQQPGRQQPGRQPQGFQQQGHQQQGPFQQGGFADESTQPGSAFGGAVATSSPLEISRPPVLLLFIALAVAIVAAVVAGIFGAPVIAIICWVLAGPVAIGIIALFVTKDNEARSRGVYSAQNWVRPLHIAASVVCILAVLVPALRIADWVGRL